MKTILVAMTLLGSMLFAADATNLLKPTNQVESWRFEIAGDSKSEMKVEGDEVVFITSAVDNTNWHVQAVQNELDLSDGTTYVLKFSAKSPEKVLMGLNAMIDQEDWHQIGLNEEVQLGKEYKDFRFEFTASGTVKKANRISFVLGNNKGTVSLKDVTLIAK